MSLQSRFRSPEEDAARSQCRLIARDEGARLSKLGRTRVEITPCKLWPDGLTTAFHGWVDLLGRLHLCRANPELVTDGVYLSETSLALADD
jgi:hypothetical protein